MPAGVARSRELPTGATSPSPCSTCSRCAVEAPAGQLPVALEVDAFGQPQPHQQEFVGLFGAR